MLINFTRGIKKGPWAWQWVTAVWRTRHICSPESAWSHHNRPIAEFRDNFISSPQHSPMSCSPESPGHFISSQPLHTRFPPISKAWWSANLYNKEIELNEACFPHYAQLGLMFNCETCDLELPRTGDPRYSISLTKEKSSGWKEGEINIALLNEYQWSYTYTSFL